MNPEQYQQLPAAPFPAPPPFWKYFTKDNLSALADRSSTTSPTQPSTSTTLPLELTFLRPPPPPPQNSETYTTFSVPQSLQPAIPAAPPPDILLFDPTTTPPPNPSLLLTRLTKSILLNFLELTSVLGTDPMQYEEKMGDINRIMLNVHYVINMYRPHQAREGVKEMLMERLESGKREIERCEEIKGRVEEFLKAVEERGKEGDGDGGVVGARNGDGVGKVESEGEEEAKKLWEMIHGLDDG